MELQSLLYIAAQLLGSILASATLAGVLDVTPKDYFGTIPVGSNGQSLTMEIIITFLLMFVISGVSTDSRAVLYSNTFEHFPTPPHHPSSCLHLFFLEVS